MWDPGRPGTSASDDSVNSARGHAVGTWVHRLLVPEGLGVVLSAGADCAVVE